MKRANALATASIPMIKLVTLMIVLVVAAGTADSAVAASNSRNVYTDPDMRNAYGESWGVPVSRSYDYPAPGDQAKGNIH
jgi:hypothetical protein